MSLGSPACAQKIPSAGGALQPCGWCAVCQGGPEAPKPAPPAITLRDGLRWALDVLERLAVTDEDYEYGDGEPVNAGPVVAKLRALLGASVEPLAAVDLDALEAAASSGDLGLVDDTVLSLIARLRAAEARDVELGLAAAADVAILRKKLAATEARAAALRSALDVIDCLHIGRAVGRFAAEALAADDLALRGAS